jgi:SAM-dependent methyltransferase
MKAVERARPYFEIANLEIPKILECLPKGLRVLDVGCGSGVHGAELKRIHHHSVVGVDLSTASIEKAGRRLDAAYVADVTKPREYPFAAGERFDVLLFSDILEHLTNPPEVLTRHLFLLKPGGHTVISLPNIAIWNVRFQLLFGNFRYEETGTLDKTHLRFFTWRTMREMFETVGFELIKSRTTPGIVRPFVPLVKRLYTRTGAIQDDVDSSSIMDSWPYRFYCRFLYPIESLVCRLWPGLLAFQLVSLCQPRGAAEPAETPERVGEYAVSH